MKYIFLGYLEPGKFGRGAPLPIPYPVTRRFWSRDGESLDECTTPKLFYASRGSLDGFRAVRHPLVELT